LTQLKTASDFDTTAYNSDCERRDHSNKRKFCQNVNLPMRVLPVPGGPNSSRPFGGPLKNW
jgi:hypothetical protein